MNRSKGIIEYSKPHLNRDRSACFPFGVKTITNLLHRL